MTHIEKVQPHVDKLLKSLAKQNISFSKSFDSKLNNVIFSNGIKELVIANHCFYGYSRMGCAVKEIKNSNNVEFVPITDDMYINTVMKNVIENYFK